MMEGTTVFRDAYEVAMDKQDRYMLGVDCVQCIISLLDDDLFQLPQGGPNVIDVSSDGTRYVSAFLLQKQFLNYPCWYVALWALYTYEVYDDDFLGKMTIDQVYQEFECELRTNPRFGRLKEAL